METKIRLLSTLLAIAAGILCVFLTIDELLPHTQSSEILQKRYEVKDEGAQHIDFVIETDAGRRIELPVTVYAGVSVGDEMELYFTPIFKQLKAFTNYSPSTGMEFKKGNPKEPRDVPFATGIAALILSAVSAFVIRRFELKVALAFLAIVTTAVRWWFIGI